MSYIPWTIEEDALALSDKSAAMVSILTGRTAGAVTCRRTYLKRKGVNQPVRHGSRGVTLTDAQIVDLKRWVSEGLSAPKIGKFLGHSRQVVYRFMQEYAAKELAVVNAEVEAERREREANRRLPKDYDTNPVVAEVKRLFSTGLTMTEIADQMGLASRNVVAGILSRYGHDLRKSRPTVPRKPIEKAAVPKPKSVVVKAPAVVEKPLPLMVVIQTNPTPFVEASGCRWPLWDPAARLDDKRVCGSECGRDTYCVDHTRLAYRTPERRAA